MILIFALLPQQSSNFLYVSDILDNISFASTWSKSSTDIFLPLNKIAGGVPQDIVARLDVAATTDGFKIENSLQNFTHFKEI